MDVPRCIGSIWQAGGLAWAPVKYGEKRSAVLRCPSGHRGSLAHSDGGAHEIDTSGNVTPSVQCPGCGFHETLRLIGWEP